MKQVKALFGQTVLDIAIQELGDVSRAIEIALLNGLSLTADLSAGQVLSVPQAAKDVRSIVQLFTDKANAPASGNTVGGFPVKEEGIDFWAIENDFQIQ